jgi:guanylate kinase
MKQTAVSVRPGKLIVLSGPSGSGKSTLIDRALAPGDLNVRLAISATTRAPRAGETEGGDYYYLTRAQFDQAVADHQFLEWAEVYGHRYGTLRSEVDPYLERGESVLLEIDVQGAVAVRSLRPDCVLVFLRASSLAEYERRLRARQTESTESLARRVAGAARELAIGETFDHQVINDNLDEAVQEFRKILLECGGTRRAG